MSKKRLPHIMVPQLFTQKPRLNRQSSDDDELIEAIKRAYPGVDPDDVEHPDSSDEVWTSKDKRKTPIRDMATRHIINTIKLIERGDHAVVDTRHFLYNALKAELDWRNQLTKRGVAIPRKRKDPAPGEDMSPGGIFFEENPF